MREGEQSQTLSRALYPALMAPQYISLAYLIYFNDKGLPVTCMLAECGRGSILFQSPVTYQVETVSVSL